MKRPLWHYRKYGSVKGTRQMRVFVSDEIFEFFDSLTHDKEGRKRRSRGTILEALVELARGMPEALASKLKKMDG